jgi:hypothetical protein
MFSLLRKEKFQKPPVYLGARRTTIAATSIRRKRVVFALWGVGCVGYGSVEGGVGAAIDGAQALFFGVILATCLLDLCTVAQSGNSTLGIPPSEPTSPKSP